MAQLTSSIFRSLLPVFLLLLVNSCAVPTLKPDSGDPIRPTTAESISRDNPLPSPVPDQQFLLPDSLSATPPVGGNNITLLSDGELIYAYMFDAVQDASSYIHIETFQIGDDEIGNRLSDLLLKKRSEGVEVNLIYDSYGSRHTPAAFFHKLELGGIEVLEYNPINPLKTRWFRRPIHRDHRKIMVVDGKIGFVGSANIGEIHCTSSSGKYRTKLKEYWKDLHLKILGPATARLEQLFLETWEERNGPKTERKKYFPQLEHFGDQSVQIVGSKPGEPNRINYRAYVWAIKNAKSSIYLTTPYFVPDVEMRRQLVAAARRGVDVRIIVPKYSDSRLATEAGSFRYEQLLHSGIRIYQHKAMIHAKSAVVDGAWCAVGTTNLDAWGLHKNDEVDAFSLDPRFIREVDSIFETDLDQSREISLPQWRNRPLEQRLKEWFDHFLEGWA